MRIAVLGHSRGIVGGAETYLRWLLPAMVARGHAMLFAFEEECTDPARLVDQDLQALARVHLEGRSNDAVVAELQRFAPDVVFTHCLARTDLEFAVSARFPTVLFAHAFYGACATGERRHGFPELEICRRKFGAACLGLNYFRSCGTRRPARLLRTFRQQRDRAVNLECFGGVVVASAYMRSVYENEGVAPEKLHVVPYPTLGLRPDPEPPASRSPTDRLLFLGRVTKIKGLSHAVTATKLASRAIGRELTLCIAGEGPALNESLELARGLGVKVDFRGWIDGSQKLELFRSADLLLLPSTWPEPFGIVGIEGGCVGVPTVGYGVGGTLEWLVPGVSGEIAGTARLEPTDLAVTIVRALSDERLQSLRVGAWQQAARFNPERHVDELERALTMAISESPLNSDRLLRERGS